MTGYMSPEILMSDDFGLESDIFSFGVILCEIAARKVVHTNVFERQIPSFGLDTDEIRQRASFNCPPDFVELCIACVKVNPVERPKIRDILDRLRQIEANIITDQAHDVSYNVGSLRFTAAAGRDNGQGKGPNSAADLKTDHFGSIATIPAVQFDSEDEELDEALAKLEKLQVGGKGSVYLNGRGAEAVSNLAQIEDGKLNTYSVIKPSKTTPRSNICDRPSSPVPGSSIVTVKGHAAPEYTPSADSLPSLPASWLEAARKANADNSLGGMFASTRSELEEDKTFKKVDHAITVESLKAVLGGTPNIVDAAPEDLPKSRFATIRSLSMPILAAPETQGSIPKSLSLNLAPHRFTLIRPGWRAIWEQGLTGGQVVQDKRLSKRFSAIPGSAIITGQLLGAGLLTRCTMCTKRLGLMKPYLACDDCGHIYHIRCGDLAVPDCGHTPAKNANDGKKADAAVTSKAKGRTTPPTMSDLAF